jgi:hypothetical protein
VTWLQIFGLVVKVALALADIVRERKLMEAGSDSAIREHLEKTHALVEKARAARRAAASGGMQDDDPYLRD